jgi:hypothetical protein
MRKGFGRRAAQPTDADLSSAEGGDRRLQGRAGRAAI